LNNKQIRSAILATSHTLLAHSKITRLLYFTPEKHPATENLKAALSHLRNAALLITAELPKTMTTTAEIQFAEAKKEQERKNQ
jgi:hypothetical protein